MSMACAICGEDDSRVLKEHHHVFGQSISPVKILLCHNCHDKITSIQNEFPPSARNKNAKRPLKIAYALRTFGSLLEVAGKQLVTFSDEMLEDE
jgi:hypothetical protein